MIAAAIWTAVALVGLYVQGRMLRDARDDLMFLRRCGFGHQPIAELAQAHLLVALFRMEIVVANFALGILAILAALRPDPLLTLAVAVLAPAQLILAEVLMITFSWFDTRTRRRLARRLGVDVPERGNAGPP